MTHRSDRERVLDGLISEAQRIIDRQWQENGELSLYLTAVLLVLIAAAVFVLPEAENLRRPYQIRLLFQGAEISLLWAFLTIWMSLFARPLALGANVARLFRFDDFGGSSVAFKELLYCELYKCLAANHSQHSRRKARFYSGHALVAAAIYFLSLALFGPLDFLSDVPPMVLYVAAGLVMLGFVVTLHRNVGYDLPGWPRYWVAPCLLLIFFAVGPAILIAVNPDILTQLPTLVVVVAAVSLYLLVVIGIWATHLPLGARQPQAWQTALQKWRTVAAGQWSGSLMAPAVPAADVKPRSGSTL